MKRHSLTVCLLAGMLGLSFSGCEKESVPPTVIEPTVVTNLVYYTIGNPDADLELVNEKANEILAKKIGVTLTYEKIGWADYESRLNATVASGLPLDVAFAINFTTYAQRGAWLSLNSYLEGDASTLYDAVNPLLWEGVQMADGTIYGVPTSKEVATQRQWMYAEELVKKYNIDITAYNTLESLEPILAQVKEGSPDYITMELDSDARNFFKQYGYEYLYEKSLPLMVHPLDASPQVVNIFETAEAEQTLRTLRKYYLAGYINEDAAVHEPEGLTYQQKVFWKESEGGPLSEISWSRDRGYTVVAHPVSSAVVTTESTRSAVMAVSSSSNHPDEAVDFLVSLNTDPEVRNLFNFGVEGVHYTLSDAGQVLLKDDGESSRYTGVQYTQGNWFILKTLGGKYAEPLDKWEQYDAYNSEAARSNLLGFIPDLSGYSVQLSYIRQVWDKYYPALMTGSVDVDVELPKFLEELKQSGIEEVQSALQSQIDDWMAQH